MFKKLFLLFVTLTTLGAWASAQVQTAGVAFYNLENLFDTLPNNRYGKDIEYTPDGRNQWDAQKYANKLHNLAFAISNFDTGATPQGPAIIGVSEIENRKVLEDLVAQPELKKWNLQICHHDSPDQRGIDVGLLYNPELFTVENVTNHRLTAVPFATRDQMCVVGSLQGQRIAIIVNHWPSRLGGQLKSSPSREAAAELCMEIADSLWKTDPDMGVIIMGDLNDDPQDKSVASVLGAKRKVEDITGPHGFYNPFYDILHEQEIGTLTYKGDWNLFDQIILSGNLVTTPDNRWHLDMPIVMSFQFLRNSDIPGQGDPLRTFSRGEYLNGYSDHFPTQVLLVRDTQEK